VRIQPIVEGFGEVEAVPVLLRRLRDEAGVYAWDVNQPIRKKRSELVQESALRRAVKLAKLQIECRAILILFDSDDDCPKDLAPVLQGWAQAEAAPLPCAVVMAHREYEAWFLATVESLRGKRGIRDDALSHPQPEVPRDAKGQLETRMLPGRSYSETMDQAALTAQFDLAIAHARCRSFRHIVKAFGVLAGSSGTAIAQWPPSAWQAGS
jgi:hypothetical protein